MKGRMIPHHSKRAGFGKDLWLGNSMVVLVPVGNEVPASSRSWLVMLCSVKPLACVFQRLTYTYQSLGDCNLRILRVCIWQTHLRSFGLLPHGTTTRGEGSQGIVSRTISAGVLSEDPSS